MAFFSTLGLPFRRLNLTLTPRWLVRTHRLPGFHQKRTLVRHSSTIAALQRDNLDPKEPIEEETLPDYDSCDYCPVRLGEVLADKYRVVSKLGFGSRSTVWLCKDESQQPPEFVAVKAFISQMGFNPELQAYLHLDTLQSQHEGRRYFREACDYFKVDGLRGEHLCLVQEPLGVSLGDVLNRFQRGPLEASAVRYIVRRVLKALDYLHTEAKIVHTDVTPNNVMLAVDDKSIFQRMEQSEIDNPTPQKQAQCGSIYPSRLINLLTSNTPVLSDLSEARLGDAAHQGYIMPDPYRAPEVLLDMAWSSPVDIWSVGMMVWDLLEAKHLMPGRDVEGKYCEEVQLAQMIGTLGVPPPDFLMQSKKSQGFFDAQGQRTGKVSISTVSLDARLSVKEPAGEERNALVRFLRKMLQWKPEDRSGARELLSYEWLWWNSEAPSGSE